MDYDTYSRKGSIIKYIPITFYATQVDIPTSRQTLRRH